MKKEGIIGLIPVHINLARDDEYFYEFDNKKKEWVKLKPISEEMKRGYKYPLTKSKYK